MRNWPFLRPENENWCLPLDGLSVRGLGWCEVCGVAGLSLCEECQKAVRDATEQRVMKVDE